MMFYQTYTLYFMHIQIITKTKKQQKKTGVHTTTKKTMWYMQHIKQFHTRFIVKDVWFLGEEATIQDKTRQRTRKDRRTLTLSVRCCARIEKKAHKITDHEKQQQTRTRTHAPSSTQCLKFAAGSILTPWWHSRYPVWLNMRNSGVSVRFTEGGIPYRTGGGITSRTISVFIR